ncbi:TonB-dependent receptor [bacterium]|nr:TonB-dependent receptor [bacterium]NUN44828.1 TonB-dependent receptor [bacterium]
MLRCITILWIIGYFHSGTVSSQEYGSINGFVYDAANGEAVIGANVFINGTKLGAVTNLNGYYVIPKVPAGIYLLVVQSLGYKDYTQKITVKPGDKLRVNTQIHGEDIQGEEIVVTADSIPTIMKLFEEPISRIELTGTQINQIPQVAESDLLRSLQTLPGILPVSDFSSELYVRGGTPDQNLYLLDGTDVYNPEHAFGLFSTFNTDAIKQVQISKGGFGAEYGGRLSSILNVTNLDGNRKEFEGSAGISLLSAKTTLQMPIGNFGSVSASIRRTYFDKTLGQAIDEIPNYYFYDGNIKAFFELDSRNTLTISTYGGRDVLNFNFNENAEDKSGIDYDWGNKTGSIRWTRVFNPNWFGNFWVTGSVFSSQFHLDEIVDEDNFISDITIKGNIEYHQSKQFIYKLGFEQKTMHGKYQQDFPNGAVDVDAHRYLYTMYGQTNWRPNEDWDIEAGLRYDYFDSPRDYQFIDPRLAAKYRINETTNLKASAGRYHQYVHRIPRTFFASIWTTTDQYQKASEAYHFITGFEKTFDDVYQVEIETYYKKYNSIYTLNRFLVTDMKPSYYDEQGNPIFTNTNGIFNHGNGNSIGLELMLRKDVGAFTGWVGYSLARTEYNVEGKNHGQSFTPRHDRTHTINAVGNLDIRNGIRVIRGLEATKANSRWTLGFNFIYSSGQPITRPGSLYVITPTPDNGNPVIIEYPDDINNYRLPYYARLDVSLTYEKQFKSWSIAPYLQIYNIGNRKNVWFIDYPYEIKEGGTIKPKVKTTSMFPMLPSIGINFTF